METAGDSKSAFVYMVECEDNSVYTGITKDIRHRMKQHFFKTGRGAKYTRSRPVKAIKMVWEVSSYSLAAKLEYAIKQLPRVKKLRLIEAPEQGPKELLPQLREEDCRVRMEYIGSVGEIVSKV